MEIVTVFCTLSELEANPCDVIDALLTSNALLCFISSSFIIFIGANETQGNRGGI